jgi:hypothetical protein
MGTGHPPKLRNYASTGFSRRTRVRSITRAGRGSYLRKHLQHRDLLTRLLLIVNALNNVDALADRVAPLSARPLAPLRHPPRAPAARARQHARDPASARR